MAQGIGSKNRWEKNINRAMVDLNPNIPIIALNRFFTFQLEHRDY